MREIFFLVTALVFGQAFIVIVKEKQYFSVHTMLILGVYLPLLLYFAGWSDKIVQPVSDAFYAIFIYLGVFTLFFGQMRGALSFRLPSYSLKRGAPLAADGVAVLYLVCFLAENYLGSGSLFPTLEGIDIHTYSAPILSFVTRSVNVALIFLLIVYFKDKKGRHLFMAALLVLVPVATRGARMTVFVALFECALLVAYVLLCRKREQDKRLCPDKGIVLLRKAKAVCGVGIVLLLAVFFVKAFVVLTELRWSQWGKYEVSYARSIAYTGPSLFQDILCVYYGYFPLSFNNLNLNILYRDVTPNYIGLYTFKSFYYGVLQLDNLLGIDPYLPLVGQLVTSGVATVETGFYEMYFDYGFFCFIPIAVMLGIVHFFQKRAAGKNSLLFLVFYFIGISLVFFTSFQNVFFGSSVLVSLFFFFLLWKAFLSEG